MAHAPISFPPELPISARVKDIAQAIDAHSVVVVAGATGSGKTTQLPKVALAMGRGLEKLIGVTQPRRIAATSVAARVAEELGSPLGTDVGYQIRFDDRTSAQTYVKFMTDGILLAEIEGDPLLRRYDTIVVDEAHERSLTIDFLLGWLKRILPQRPDLKVIISSATIETARFSEFFDGAPVIEVEGRTFPVDVLYEPPPDDADLVEAVANAVENVTTLDPRGDILVFLPGEREIRDCENELNYREKLGRLRHTVVQPLYARLSAGEQHKVFTTIPQRRVILATNVAETSVTIPGIVYVVDPGIARLSRYDPRSGTTQLHIEGISQASAEQRKGRCGRVRDGICVRLFDEQSFKARPAFTDPEIKRTGLAGVILRMKSLGLGDVDAFPFLDPPNSRSVTEGYRVLEELGAIDDKRDLTAMGRRLARFPVDPRIGRMIIAGAELGVLREVLVIAAALNTQDPRERPREKQQQADDAHRRFRDEKSDFIALLRLWEYLREVEKKGTGNLRRTCKAEYISFLRAREWSEIHRQLEDITRELKIAPAKLGGGVPVEDALHRALLTGLLSKVGQWNPEQRVYIGAKQTRFAIHPSSALAKKPPAWVMAFELVETTQLFARMSAKIDPHWLAEAAPHLLKRSYSDPHWSEKSARAMVKEYATLFGLVVAKDRSVDYASVAPLEARKIFVEHALVRGEYRTKGDFQQRNGEMLLELARLRDKARKSDMLADDDALYAFFDERVPAEVVDGKTFEEWRERAEKKDPDLLVLSLDDVLRSQPDLDPKDYPDTLVLHGTKLPVTYLFDPGSDADGITLTIPLALVPQLDPGELGWTVPGWHEDKVIALLQELPRAERRDLGDIPALAKTLARELKPWNGAILPQIAERVGISSSAFRPDAIARYLQTNIRIVDESGRELAQGRDVDALLKQYGARARAVWQKAPEKARTGFTTWNFGELEPFVLRRIGDTDVRRYPAIVDKGQSVDIELLDSSSAAEEATRAGLGRLFQLGARQTLSAIVPRLPPAFARPSGAQASRVETEQFRAHLVDRIVDLAFQLDQPIPRKAADFDARLKTGLPRVNAAAKVLTDAIAPIQTELNETLASLRSAGKHPSGRLALLDIQVQLEHLFPLDVMRWIPLPRLEHYPRYLRAARARLQRAIADPRKDADKHAPFAPLWQKFLAKKDPPSDLRWLFEELRVAIFAPELKTPVPVSIAKVSAAL